MIVYKFDVLPALKEAGYSTYVLQRDNILPRGTLTKLKNNDTDISLKTLNKICELLDMQPGNIIKRVADDE